MASFMANVHLCSEPTLRTHWHAIPNGCAKQENAKFKRILCVAGIRYRIDSLHNEKMRLNLGFRCLLCDINRCSMLLKITGVVRIGKIVSVKRWPRTIDNYWQKFSSLYAICTILSRSSYRAEQALMVNHPGRLKPTVTHGMFHYSYEEPTSSDCTWHVSLFL